MKRKLSFLFLSALTIPFFMVSCSDDKEEQEVKPATDLVVDNNSVTLLQGDEITVSITSGNGDYYVKPFDENVATATIIGEKRLVKILTGNGDYQISIPEGADKFLEVGELSGQVIPLTAKFETGADPVNITITDKNGDKSRFEPIECPHSY